MDNVKAVCNWTRIGGCDWEQAIQTEVVEDEILKPETSDILSDERALLLHRKMKVESETDAEACELQLKIFPRYKISGLTIVCSAPKIEIFVGVQDEYYETEHGILLQDDIDNTENLRSYRYDMEIDKSGISEMTLKFLTSSDEICIFAILLQIAPNPNGVTTLLPRGINIDNVQKMLQNSSQKLTPSAEKCKKLLEMCSKVPPANSSTPLQENIADVTFEKLKIHVDKRFEELESKILARFYAFETQQTAKLDEILKTLQALK